jgi:tetratricopeptide (TPR) repeat protein
MLFGTTKSKANKLLARALQTGDFAAAISAFEKLRKKNPHDHEVLNNLGVAYLESGDNKSAASTFGDAIELNENGLLWNNLGRALLHQKQHDDARRAFSRARELDDSDAQSWYNLTVCMREQGDNAESLNELERFLEKFPKHANGLNDRGCFYDEAGQKDAAIECFSNSITANPDHVPSRLNLIRMLCDSGRFPESTSHLEHLARIGMHVKVDANDKGVKIELNGKTFYNAKKIT